MKVDQEVIDRSGPGDSRGVQIERKYTLQLSPGTYRFFVRSAAGGAQFLLFKDKVLIGGGTLDFQETPFPHALRTESDDWEQPFPQQELDTWMRTWPPEERLLIDCLSQAPLTPKEQVELEAQEALEAPEVPLTPEEQAGLEALKKRLFPEDQDDTSLS